MKAFGIASLFVVCLGIFLGLLQHIRTTYLSMNAFPSSRLFSREPLFHLNAIDGIENVFEAVASLKIPEQKNTDPVQAAILPHHTLIADEIGSFWKDIASRTNPSVIVLVGPAHQNQGTALLQTTHGIWTTPFGNTKTHTEMINRLLSFGAIQEEPPSFENEHSIGVHIPYIAKLFPEIPIIPIIAKSPAGTQEAEQLIRELDSLLPKDALIISSVDFSHGLPAKESEARDTQTLSFIKTRSYEQIERLDETFLDSPFAVMAFLLWTDTHKQKEEWQWQQNSGSREGNPDAPGTSYLVFFTPTKQPPLILTAVGDIMLSRSVATWLEQTTILEVFTEAKYVMEKSDLVFGNLESVLSRSQVEIEKSIRFKANPERVDVLQFLGMTHVSVSNNHINDYGEAAWEESRGYLQNAGIQPVGGYRNDGEVVVREIQGQRVVFLAFETWNHALDPLQVKKQVEEAKTKGNLVIVSFHWGYEYEHVHHPSQTLLAHTAIDAGADLILGHHPHVLQGIEKYKDGLILYSLGNFVFDQFGEDENESVVARFSFEEKTRSIELIPMRIKRGFPRVAIEEEQRSTMAIIASWSEPDISEDLLDGKIHW